VSYKYMLTVTIFYIIWFDQGNIS